MKERIRLNFGKARRRVNMRSALLLTLGVCFVMALYRALSSMAIIRLSPVTGVLTEALLSLLVFGGAAYLGLLVLDGDQSKILPRGTLSRAQTRWLVQTGVLLVAPMTLGADVLEALFVRPAVQPLTLQVQAPGVFLLSAIKSALLVPVLEELFFRGYLLGALERYGHARAAAVSALCFALVHMGAAPHALIMYAVLGLLLAALTLHTGSLIAPVLVHACCNLTLILLSHAGLSWFFENLSFLSCVLRLTLCALCIRSLKRAWKARGTVAQVQPMQPFTRKEWVRMAMAAVAVLAATLLAGGGSP